MCEKCDLPPPLCRAETHGQVSKELAEPYYLYGRALLDLAREKSAMFGKGIPGMAKRLSVLMPCDTGGIGCRVRQEGRH